jgi:hypothetical protein
MTLDLAVLALCGAFCIGVLIYALAELEFGE